jgi:hypothetical protein
MECYFKTCKSHIDKKIFKDEKILKKHLDKLHDLSPCPRCHNYFEGS